jgi:hypothetical protein
LKKTHLRDGRREKADKKGVNSASAELTPVASGAETQNRTGDTRIFSPLLYRLSYLGNLRVGIGAGFFPSPKRNYIPENSRVKCFFVFCFSLSAVGAVREPPLQVSHKNNLRELAKSPKDLFPVIPAKPVPAGFKPGAGIQLLTSPL